jgi:malonyl-CoA decarboxylase
LSTSFLSNLFTSLSERGRQLLKIDDVIKKETSLLSLTQMLISRRGEATGVALATEILARFKASSSGDKLNYLLALARDFGIETAKIQQVAEEFTKDPTPANALKLHAISEPKRQEVLRRLNLAPKGTYNLIKMREEIFPHLNKYPELASLDEDFRHLFSSWFNRGFLTLKQIDWQTPANILEKIIKYEAVHAIRDWDDLRQRIEPQDRRLFAFFHPQINDEPLIFVEVALTDHMPDDISDLLQADREEITLDLVNTACFYSISNCQEGLRGISFGHFLIKQVVENLSSEIPSLKTFVTLSPVPSLRTNLKQEFNPLTATAEEQLRLKRATADFLINQKTNYNRPRDPVARFHLGNGAILERVNFAADLSDKGLRDSYGMMVNYLYSIKSIVENHENFAESGIIAASSQVKSLLN